MQVGFIGVRRMGKVMARNLLKAGHQVLAWDVSQASLDEIKGDGAGIDAPVTVERPNPKPSYRQALVKWIAAIEFVRDFAGLGAGPGGYNEDHKFYGYWMPI